MRKAGRAGRKNPGEKVGRWNCVTPFRSVLKRKDSNAWSVPPGVFVSHAIAIMSYKQVGALPVLRGPEGVRHPV